MSYNPDTIADHLATAGYRMIYLRRREWVIISPRGQWWSLADNGGEFNLWHVNVGEVIEVPYTYFNAPVSDATLAYRLLQKMQGKPVDWDLDVEEWA